MFDLEQPFPTLWQTMKTAHARETRQQRRNRKICLMVMILWLAFVLLHRSPHKPPNGPVRMPDQIQ
jgi:hypothetical protein